MHVLFDVVDAALAFVLVAGFIAGIWELVKAVDLKFDPKFAAQHDRKANWAKARKEQVVVPFLGLPLGLIVIALLVIHPMPTLNWGTYAYIAIAWLVSAPLRRFWELAVAIKLDHKLKALGFKNEHYEAYEHTTWTAFKTYYRNGTRRPGQQVTDKKRRVFVGRLQSLNKVSWLWRWMRHLRVCIPFAVEALTAVVWPITATVMVFVHSTEAAEEVKLDPWWSRD